MGVGFPQSEKGREYGHVAEKEHYKVQSEETPEKGRVGSQFFYDYAEEAYNGSHDAGGEGGADWHIVFYVPGIVLCC